MAVVAHYVDKKFRNTNRLIALRNLNGSHSGANMTELLIKIIKEFDIQDLLGYFVTDNADNNDIYINAVLRTLMPDLFAKERSRRRLRCWGHILNLAANALLYGDDPESFEAEILV